MGAESADALYFIRGALFGYLFVQARPAENRSDGQKSKIWLFKQKTRFLKN
jgi:hypothetical protein